MNKRFVNFAKFLRIPFFTEHLGTTACVISEISADVYYNDPTVNYFYKTVPP